MEEERERVMIIPKLDALKNVAPKIMAVHRLQDRLSAEIETVQMEEATLAAYREDLELLLQEKMAHVEELRLIHADINAMESIIKSAEETRAKSLEHARRLHDEYQSQKHEVIARMNASQQVIGHDVTLPFLAPENDPVPPNFFEKAGIDWNMDHDDLASSSNPPGLTMSSLGSIGAPPPFLSPQGPPSLTPMRSTPHKVDQRPLPPPPGPPAPAFRQQPPPMKSCLSCHQQIHRNAPICPLCKAKSRSRNPKKPKKKD